MRAIIVGALLVAAAGCVESEDPKTSMETLTARDQAWLDHALPVLTEACVACHAGSVTPDIAFLDGETPLEQRDTLASSALVDLELVHASRLLTKGVHAGPALSAAQTSELLLWLAAERETP